jgi:hypothetical protein
MSFYLPGAQSSVAHYGRAWSKVQTMKLLSLCNLQAGRQGSLGLSWASSADRVPTKIFKLIDLLEFQSHIYFLEFQYNNIFLEFQETNWIILFLGN